MENPTIKITAKVVKKGGNTDATDKGSINKIKDSNVDSIIDNTIVRYEPPETKEALLALYQTEALPINNSINKAELDAVNKQRVALYKFQIERTKFLYTSDISIRPTYLVQKLKSQFIEYQNYQTVRALDQRGLIDLDKVDNMWKQLHIVDDLIADIIRLMPAQLPVGWQITSVNKNHLKLPTVGRLRDKDSIADQTSINSYVLGHFGVMSYTYDRAYFIGHVIGYLFCCYYMAHLSISYGVTPLPEDKVEDYDYSSLETAKIVRLLHGVDVLCKRRIYQLAVFCARLSIFKLDKYVEKMLITEVNEFDKKQQIADLDALLEQGLMPETTMTINKE